MTNLLIGIIIGVICGTGMLSTMLYIQDKTEDAITKKIFGEDYETVIMSKSDYEVLQKIMNKK